MQIFENKSLKEYNTFHLQAAASYFVEVTTTGELIELLSDPRWKNTPKLILGGGSNVLFTGDFDGLVIRVAIQGKEIIQEDDQSILLKVGAGETWHKFVLYCVEAGYAGVENLSLIPGTVGAAPLQNIGAYGVEIKEVFDELESVEIVTGTIRRFTRDECQFGYRESVFKNELKNKYIITSVTFRLSKIPQIKVSYGDIQKTLEANGVEQITIQEVSKAVIQIRKSKLPDPAELGNAGSFFKNPEIPTTQYHLLKEKHTNIPGYPTSSPDTTKVPAGWLIEQAGWKGYREDQAGVHEKQALVLVNYGEATGYQIMELAKKIQDSVWENFSIRLSTEVNYIG
jgi:UDP-N-acetylmuramate dehydrogenase